MSQTLKHLLLRIAQLPRIDQRWIMRQLSDPQQKTLQQHQGLKLLAEAQYFRGLNANRLPLPAPEPEPLPDYCEQLATQAPLYIAIILLQGTYPWQARFLKKYDTNQHIQSKMQHDVSQIKTLTQQALFSEWTRTLPFETQLEITREDS